jgi:predicted nucleic acid-binding protein
VNTSLTYCVDASFVIRLIESGIENTEAVLLWEQWHEKGYEIVAPNLLLYEVSNAFFQYVRHEILLLEEAQDALKAVIDFDIMFYSDVLLHTRAMDIAQTYDLKASYDAHYLALAEQLGAEFWTADARLARAMQPHLDWVHIIDS